MSSGLVLVGTAGSANAGKDKVHKVYVCKYVGKPGVDERLKAGKNPIQVAMQATDGTWFNDAQGRSFVLWAVGDPNHPVPTRADCPVPENNKPKLATASVDEVQPSCDDPNGSWTASATNATVDGGVTSGDGVRNGSVTVDFTADQGAEFAGGSSTKSITVDFGDVVPPPGFTFNPETNQCEAVAGPPIAVPKVDVVQPSCDDPNGSWTASITNGSVVGDTSGDGVRNGSVTVHFTADEGAQFEGGATTAQITVDFGDVVPPQGSTFDPTTGLCVAVSPPTTSQPTPTPVPTPSSPSTQVSPPQVSTPTTTTTVPSTVEAGLAGADQGSSREPGLVLTAVGALLLVAAGSLVPARRRGGAHI